MATQILETIIREEFDRRLDNSNKRLQQELVEATDRVQRLEALIARKEVFADRLAHMLTEIEQEESEIAALEQGLRLRRTSAKRRASASQSPSS